MKTVIFWNVLWDCFVFDSQDCFEHVETDMLHSQERLLAKLCRFAWPTQQYCCSGLFFCYDDSLSLGDNHALRDDRIDLYVCFMSSGLCDTLYKCRPQQLMVMLAASIANPACLWHKVCTVLWKCQIWQSHLFCEEFLSPLISKTK